MADVKELFRSLVGSAGEGVALDEAVNDTTSATGITGSAGYAYKTSAGVVTLLALTPDGKVPVDTEGGGGTCISDSAKVTGVVANTDIVTLTLTIARNYSGLEFNASCLRDTAWEIVYIDDVGGSPTEVTIWQSISGNGQYHIDSNLKCADFNTTGGTGTQNLVLRGENLQVASDYRGYMGIIERTP